MLVYKVDPKDKNQINAEIRSIANELSTLTPTLRRLKSSIARHSATIDSPSITQFRENLYHMLTEAEAVNQRLSENALMLVEVSEQASEHLIAVEKHYDAILKEKTLANYLNTTSVA